MRAPLHSFGRGWGALYVPLKDSASNSARRRPGSSYLLTLGEEYLSRRPSPRKLQKDGGGNVCGG